MCGSWHCRQCSDGMRFICTETRRRERADFPGSRRWGRYWFRGGAHIGIIFTEAGLGGNSFNDLALEGVKKAAADYGITYDEVEPKSVSDEEIIQDEMAASGDYDLIICVGAEQVDALTNVASTYPEQRFALLDATSDLPNVASYSCKEQEGAFLAGALAALAKQEKTDDKLGDGKTIGFIGGVDNPLINRFAAGYKAGAEYIEPEMKVLVDYAGGFNDPTTAKTIANTFKEKGADVIFHAAGASGMGMFQAAEEKRLCCHRRELKPEQHRSGLYYGQYA